MLRNRRRYQPRLALNIERSLQYLVPRWLVRNAKNQGAKMTVKESQDLYDVYKKQVNFHSPDLEARTFKVAVGRPKLRGRRYMTLTHMSLGFHSYESAVHLYTDIWDSLPKWCGEVVKLMGSVSVARTLLKSNIAVHPHISSTGGPCLGDYGNGWAQAIVGGNIPMLVNVARSFINNWTRYDAYWNVNKYNEVWEMHKLVPFAEFLTGIHFWYQVSNARDSRPALHYRSFNRLLNREDDTGTNLLSTLLGMGYSTLEIMHYWLCVNHLTSAQRDDENNILDKMQSTMGRLQSFANDITDTVNGELGSSRMTTAGLVQKVLIRDFDNKIIPSRDCDLWTSSDNSVYESIDSFNYVGMMLRDSSQRLSSGYNYPTASDILQMRREMFEFGRYYFGKSRITTSDLPQRYLRKIMISKDEVLQKFGSWWVNNILGGRNDKKRNAWLSLGIYLLNRIDKRQATFDSTFKMMVNQWTDKGDDGVQQIGKVMYKLIMDLDKWKVQLRNADFRVQLSKEMTSEALDLISLTLKTVYGDVNEQNRKARKRAFGNNQNRDGGKNQLSIETF